MGKEGRLYWKEIKISLAQAVTQREYNGLLDFEGRDLHIRELRHRCSSLLINELSKHPGLLERCIDTNPDEAILSFFNEKREDLETALRPIDARRLDEAEIESLRGMIRELERKKSHSVFFNQIVKEYFSG